MAALFNRCDMYKPELRYRLIQPLDAEAWLRLLIQVDKESDFLLFDKDERDTNIEKCLTYINKITHSEQPNSRLIIAETAEKKMVGYICGHIPSFKKKLHLMELSSGALKDYHKGIGRELIKQLIQLAKEDGVKRLECCIMANNTVVLNGMKKIGFQIEGIKKSSIRINDEYIDEYILGMLL